MWCGFWLAVTRTHAGVHTRMHAGHRAFSSNASFTAPVSATWPAQMHTRARAHTTHARMHAHITRTRETPQGRQLNPRTHARVHTHARTAHACMHTTRTQAPLPEDMVNPDGGLEEFAGAEGGEGGEGGGGEGGEGGERGERGGRGRGRWVDGRVGGRVGGWVWVWAHPCVDGRAGRYAPRVWTGGWAGGECQRSARPAREVGGGGRAGGSGKRVHQRCAPQVGGPRPASVQPALQPALQHPARLFKPSLPTYVVAQGQEAGGPRRAGARPGGRGR
jgi:hypothetical protein